VKLYVPEEGYESVRRLPAPLLVSLLARVEVAAALWRKHRTGELDLDDTLLLNRAFAADYAGSSDRPPRFQPVEVTDATVERAAELTGTHGLRAYDAVQLACALSARELDRRCTTLASFDRDLLRAATAEGFEVLSPEETAEPPEPSSPERG
jgi:predicted nucleic acid-binding protein